MAQIRKIPQTNTSDVSRSEDGWIMRANLASMLFAQRVEPVSVPVDLASCDCKNTRNRAQSIFHETNREQNPELLLH